MSKEEQNLVASKIQQHYTCNIIVNEEEPFVLFRASDIGKILGFERGVMSNQTRWFTKTDRILIKSPTNGGDQTMIFLTYVGLLKLLSTTRKPKLIEFSTKIGIEVYTRIFACIESDTMKCILDAFAGETMIEQYRVANYRIDLYFPKYNFAVECDEPHHNTRLNQQRDIERECAIKDVLTDCLFIRYEPLNPKFSIFKLISEIHNEIVESQNRLLRCNGYESKKIEDDAIQLKCEVDQLKSDLLGAQIRSDITNKIQYAIEQARNEFCDELAQCKIKNKKLKKRILEVKIKKSTMECKHSLELNRMQAYISKIQST